MKNRIRNERFLARTCALLCMACALTSSGPLRSWIEPTARAAAKTFTVNVTGDGHDANPGDGVCETSVAGNCSLRAAIEESNANAGKDTINFQIPGAGVHTISPNTALPDITAPVRIDGYSQPGASQNTLANGDNAVLSIELSGANVSDGIGLAIRTGGATVQGLVINRFKFGIVLQNGFTNSNTIQGNFIGTNAAGNVALGNSDTGIADSASSSTIGGTTPAARNLISGNGLDPAGGTGGISISFNGDHKVQGNLIGTDAGGTVALGNKDGVVINGEGYVIGGTEAGARNVISGNSGRGIDMIFGRKVSVQGNYIGTDATGTKAVPNQDSGVFIAQDTGNSVPSPNNIIGGATPEARNVISGNGKHGVEIQCVNNQVQGNFIGTDAGGMAALPNAQSGVVVEGGPLSFVLTRDNLVGGTDVGTGNVISGNGVGGVVITDDASENTVQGNLIGTGADGSKSLGNRAVGVAITADAAGNTIGGNPVGGNTIAFNTVGVLVFGSFSTGNAISGNSIFGNTSLGIDLNNDGVTPNDAGDADDGPNGLQNFPVLNSASKNGDAAVVSGTLNSRPNASLKIELFSNPTCDPSGSGEGHKLINTTTVTTDASGNASFVAASFISDLSGPFITATATSAFGTSEFSKCTQLSSPLATFDFGQATYSTFEDCTVVTLTVSRGGDTSTAATVDYSTQGGTASERSDFNTALGTLRFAPGETAKSFDVLVNEDSFTEGTEGFNVALSNPSGATLGAQATAAVQILDDPPEPSTNTIDAADGFAGQHYHDFLNRQSDTMGLAFWTNEITSCGSNAACRDAKRVNVSGAFFLSIEFQETGGFAIRVQRAAFGRKSQDASARVNYRQFIKDSRQLGEGVVVGQPGFEERLEANKQAYTAQAAASPDFVARYPLSQTADQYVDALFASAGVTPTTVERQSATGAFGSGGTSGRVAALRSVSDSNSLRQAEFAPSFVLMQYFGYLRRNPTDAPDNNDSGYQFWLGKLNQFGGDFQKAEMVRAFILSTEYRSRFGQP